MAFVCPNLQNAVPNEISSPKARKTQSRCIFAKKEQNKCYQGLLAVFGNLAGGKCVQVRATACKCVQMGWCKCVQVRASACKCVQVRATACKQLDCTVGASCSHCIRPALFLLQETCRISLKTNKFCTKSIEIIKTALKSLKALKISKNKKKYQYQAKRIKTA